MIRLENKRLVDEAFDYKASEITKKVTALYEERYREVKQFLSNQISMKDSASIYTYLIYHRKPEHI